MKHTVCELASWFLSLPQNKLQLLASDVPEEDSSNQPQQEEREERWTFTGLQQGSFSSLSF